MQLQQLAQWLEDYRRASARTGIYRYTNTVESLERFPEVFGMNFPAILSAPPEKQAEVFLAQEQRASLLRALMAGRPVDDGAMAAQFGFTAAELEQCLREASPLKTPIPRGLCVLCFDDALKSQFELALPVLEHYGFRATFFITEMAPSPRGPGFEDKSRYMTWEQIAALERAGQELGNHSLHHVFGSQTMGRDFNLAQIRGLEQRFADHGLKKPQSYAYPSGVCTREVLDCARDCGYRWARGNFEDGPEAIRGMTYYDPLLDSPLSIGNFGDPDFYTEALLRERIAETPDGTVFGLTYHDVSPERWPGACSFERQMEILAQEGMQVIAVSDLERYIDPEKALRRCLPAD